MKHAAALIAWLALASVAQADISAALDAVCRITATDGGRDTGCVFARRGNELHVLTNAHVVGRGATAKCEFFLHGHQSRPIDGRVIFRHLNGKTSQDVAIVAVPVDAFHGRLPRIMPLGLPGRERLTPGTPIISVGCAGGNWPTAWRGHVLENQRTRITFVPPPAGGRSGSAVFDNSGNRIVALIAWRQDDEAGNPQHGVAQTLENLSATFRGRAPTMQLAAEEVPIEDPQPAGPLVEVPEVQCPGGSCPLPGFGPQPYSPPRRDPRGETPDIGNTYDAWPTMPPDSPLPEGQPDTSEPPAPTSLPVSLGSLLGVAAAAFCGGVGLKAWLARRAATYVGDRIQDRIVRRVRKKKARVTEADTATGQATQSPPVQPVQAQPAQQGPITQQVEVHNHYELDDQYAIELARKREEFRGLKIGHQAMLGGLYMEAVALLRSGAIECLGGKETANRLDQWVQREFLARHNIKIG